MKMHPIEAEIQRRSYERRCEPPESLLEELAGIPSSAIQDFREYASQFGRTERSSLLMGLYARAVGVEATTSAEDLERAAHFEAAQADMERPWDRLPVSTRHTLKLLLKRTGTIPSRCQSPEKGLTLEAVRSFPEAKFPSARQLKSFLRREFGATLDWKEPDGATSYQISETGRHGRFQTLVGYSLNGRAISCFHQYVEGDDGRVHQFSLFPYGLYTGVVTLDLIDGASLEKLTAPLRQIVSAFEEIVADL